MFVVVVAVNVVVNVLDLQWCPPNLHIHPLQSVDAPHPLETLWHPFKLHGYAPSIVSLVAMSFVVSPTFVSLVVSPMEMSSMVLLQSV